VKRDVAAAWLLAGASLAGVTWLAATRARPPLVCPEGMRARGPRCCGEGQRLEGGVCRGAPARCSTAQTMTPEGCLPKNERVLLSGGSVTRLPTDWDDTSARSPLTALAAFQLDRSEVVERDYQACVTAGACTSAPARGEPGMPQTNVSAPDAERYCAWRGGALPSSSQFAFAAMGTTGRRYPWGDAGAVCRRVAYGLSSGPCATGGTSPELAGSHPEGATPEGLVDLAGNVEEWVRSEGGYEVRGGSWQDASVTALRSFSARPAAPDERSPARGFRCVYAEGAK